MVFTGLELPLCPAFTENKECYKEKKPCIECDKCVIKELKFRYMFTDI